MPANPPRNDKGDVVAHDDPCVEDDGSLVRHINPAYHVFFDENLGRNRIKSSAFSATNLDPDYGMSCDVGQLLVEAGKPLDHKVPPRFGAVRIPVGEIRKLGLKVGSDPERDNEFHGQVWGVKDKFQRKIHQLVIDWVVPIDGVTIR